MTRSDLLRIARERGDKPPSPGKDRLFLEDLTASICEAFRRQPETRTQTLPDLYAGKSVEEIVAARRAEQAAIADKRDAVAASSRPDPRFNFREMAVAP